MWPIHPFQKHFCVLFLSIALLTTFISLKEKYKALPNGTVPVNITDDILKLLDFNSSAENEYFNAENNPIKYLNFSTVKEAWSERRDTHVVYILGLFELTTKWGRRLEGESEMSAAKLAVDHINAFNVLPGYTLELLINDTKVYEMNMYGEYVWILQNRDEIWWNTSKECPYQQKQEAVEGIIMISDFYNISKDAYSISGMGNREFEQALNMSSLHISKYAKQSYDAVWTMALALIDTEIYYWFDPIDEYRYTRKDMACRWVEKISTLNFIGLSGPVKFNGADRIGNSIVRQIQGGQILDIAIFDSDMNSLNFQCKTCRRIFWKDGLVPVAQRILKISLITIPDALFYSIVLISAMGICASFLFLYFNLHFRRIKSVKLSSPKLNNVAVLGCILVYSSVILLGFHNATINLNDYFSELCSARVYLLSAGFSLAFGSMFAKTYRVHRLFTYFGAGVVKDKLLKDKQLIALILIPLIIDALIMMLWVMIDPMEKQLYNLTLEISFSHRGIVYQPQVEVCSSHNTVGWYVALFGYKSIILIMGVFMAWQTRHIKVPALNDSQYIGICVYSAVFSTIIVVLSSFISNHVVITYLAKALSILTSTTLTLFLLLLPKLKSVFRRADCGDPIMHSMGLKIESNTRRFISDDPKEQIYRLEIQNKVYRCELAALDREISRLEELLLYQSSSCSTKSSVHVTEATVECYYLEVPAPVIGRASWPSTQDHFKQSKNDFLSENKLNDRVFEKINFFGKLKKIFGSFGSLQNSAPHHNRYQDYNLVRFCKSDKSTPRSSPEVYPLTQEPSTSMAKAKSEIYLKNTQ